MRNISYKLEEDFISLNCFFDNSIRMLNDILIDIKNFNLENSSKKISDLKKDLENYFIGQKNKLKVNRRSSDSKIVDEIIYLSVCLFDDILIHQNSLKPSLWNDDPLERRIFGSGSGGHVIFDKIDEVVLHNRERKIELSKLYYTALKVGFRGKYREKEYTTLCDKYCENLCEIFLGSTVELSSVPSPSFVEINSKYEKYIKKESIYFLIKYLFFLLIFLYLVGELYWIVFNKLMFNIR